MHEKIHKAQIQLEPLRWRNTQFKRDKVFNPRHNMMTIEEILPVSGDTMSNKTVNNNQEIGSPWSYSESRIKTQRETYKVKWKAIIFQFLSLIMILSFYLFSLTLMTTLEWRMWAPITSVLPARKCEIMACYIRIAIILSATSQTGDKVSSSAQVESVWFVFWTDTKHL